MNIKSLTKYLPRGARRRARRFLARHEIRGEMVGVLFKQRDRADADVGSALEDVDSALKSVEVGVIKNAALESRVQELDGALAVEKMERVRAEAELAAERLEREGLVTDGVHEYVANLKSLYGALKKANEKHRRDLIRGHLEQNRNHP